MQIKMTLAKFLHPAGLLNSSGHFRTVFAQQEADAPRSHLAYKSLAEATVVTLPRRLALLSAAQRN
ncbi:hypothetical protein E2C01_012638 [Portunus trituberculatus]|uniref:Uncharacterized protein n=1 Tax=Portunus trituberculatus TaxID=210409 RepID=A0A5B7DE64_PORTR|nr:hypothetical protein [Portunus trituberculatus]